MPSTSVSTPQNNSILASIRQTVGRMAATSLLTRSIVISSVA